MHSALNLNVLNGQGWDILNMPILEGGGLPDFILKLHRTKFLPNKAMKSSKQMIFPWTI